MPKKTNIEEIENEENAAPASALEQELDAQQTEIEIAKNDDVLEIEQIVKEIGETGARCHILRKGPDESGFSYVAEWDIKDVSFEGIKDEFGGGEYKLKFKNKKGQWHRTVSIKIAGIYKGRLHRAVTSGETSQALNAITPLLNKVIERTEQKSDNTALIIQMMQQNNDRSEKTMAMIMQSMQQNAQQNLMLMTEAFKAQGNRQPDNKMETIMLPIMLEMIKKPGQQMDLQTMAALLKGNGSSFKEMIETIALIKEMFGDKTGIDENDEGTMLDKIVKIGGPLLGGLMNRHQMPGQGPGSNVQSASPAQPQLAEINLDSVNPPLTPVQKDLIERLGAFKAWLIMQSKRNAPQAGIAALVRKQLTVPEWKELVSFLARQDWAVILFGNDPAVAARAEWFGGLWQALMQHDQQSQPKPEDTPAE